MGALLGGNADRQWGYKIGDKIVPPAIDKIDGGGPGRSGPTFEGGGLLSDIGNALTRPYGYRDRMQSVRPQVRPTGLLTAAPTPAPAAPRYVGPPPGVLPQDYAPPTDAASSVAPEIYIPITDEQALQYYRSVVLPTMPPRSQERIIEALNSGDPRFTQEIINSARADAKRRLR